MAVVLARIAYTQISRRRGPELSYATNVGTGRVVASEQQESTLFADDMKNNNQSVIEKEEIQTVEHELLCESNLEDHTALSGSTLKLNPVAIFPQYLTTALTTLVIREVSLPHFSESFSVHLGEDPAPIFHVTRQIPSFRRKQQLIDASSSQPIMTIRRHAGTKPRSFSFEDPTGARILNLYGDFYVPFTGAKSHALFKNAAAGGMPGVCSGNNVELLMQGSYRNRHAEIKEKTSGETVATVRCNLWNKRFLAGGRRTYVACLRAGLDMAVIVGMISAMDQRCD